MDKFENFRYFGVFDGHGGAKVAAYAANNLHRIIIKRNEFKEDNKEEAIKEGFLECDRVMKTVESLKDDMAGCTAVTVFIRGKELWCANAGDSRCVAGVSGAARPLSTDHKPMDVLEKQRIEAAGGHVSMKPSVRGCMDPWIQRFTKPWFRRSMDP